MPDAGAQYEKMFELLSIIATCIFGVLGLKRSKKLNALYLALVIILGAVALLTRSPFAGFGLLVAFGFGVGIFAATRLRTSIVVFSRRPSQSLKDEISESKVLWAVWHTGLMTGANKEVIDEKKIRRLIVSAPNSAALTELEKITVLSRAAFTARIEELTNMVKKSGGEVKWFDGPIQNSTIISNPDEPDAWARIEFLIPFAPPPSRPSIKVFKSTNLDLFNVIRSAYETLWQDQEHCVHK